MYLNKTRGFTLIEVLVTLVILTFGLLGLAGLIMNGHRATFEAYQRHQALTIANDLAERLKANQSNIGGAPSNSDIANAYVLGAPVGTPLGDPVSRAAYDATPDCSASCSRLVMVQYDLGVWEGELLGVNELRAGGGGNSGGALNTRGCVEGPLAAPSAPNTYRISVAWQGNVATVAPISSACGTGLYRDNTGVVNEATRRVVSVDVTILLPI